MSKFNLTTNTSNDDIIFGISEEDENDSQKKHYFFFNLTREELFDLYCFIEDFLEDERDFKKELRK